MSAASRGGNAMSALLRSSRRVCSQCARSHQAPAIPLTARRHFAEAATTIAAPIPTRSAPPTTDGTTTTVQPQQQPVDTSASSNYRISAGLILTRPPLLTRDPTPFEAAFYLYQKRLNERLAVPFRPSLYFRTDTAADLDWRIKVRERHGVPAKDIGRYNPRGRTAWNDEVLTGSPLASRETIFEKLLADAETRVSDDGEEIADEERVPVERPIPRRTEADEKNDVRRLDRALDRTLYLVVKGKDGQWSFPTGGVTTETALHEAAELALKQSAGVNMNTWIVGHVPVAHYIQEPTFEEGEDAKTAPEKRGNKIFFLKGRIMAGQADLTGNAYGLTDFQWLTKEEIKGVLGNDYYKSVRNMFELR
ncbi:39S mitochondrial ribosomal protein L46-domain-containing protein [Podospora aff. communis PSN243]|uniref:Large ribosomal subunit protein mL46 n=1 Tax=Podospora aff. communis PSN243 TaxID=3040156 RepID=A0AAV9H827_9PEZI|nr:39S mitochondrial ribosomal protein L46-domain-containing protein [Podospora aff. communis PSN243]